MVALLVGLAIMSVMMSMAMPVWRQAAQREKEAELAFRGEQYARAIGLFQRKFAASYPPSLDLLVEQKFLRKKYKDPVTNDDFRILYQTESAQRAGEIADGSSATTRSSPRSSTIGVGRQTSVGGRDSDSDDDPLTPFGGGSSGTLGPRGGILGVASKSKDRSIRLYKGRSRYNEWEFVYTPATTQGGQGGEGAERPGTQDGSATPGMGGRPGAVGGRPGTAQPRRPGPSMERRDPRSGGQGNIQRGPGQPFGPRPDMGGIAPPPPRR
jgi:type II secretory pathway pseudopilin PulG